MTLKLKESDQRGTFTCRTIKPAHALPTLADDARSGLLFAPRSLPPKYFYDDRGSHLFDQICATPEYYLTRTEDTLLETNAINIIKNTRPDHIIELGSGTSKKTRRLLDACGTLDVSSTYWPFDVCEPMLRKAGEGLLAEYPWLNVNALVGDYSGGFKNLPSPTGRRLIVFLGSTIGNFTTEQAVGFLKDLRTHMHAGDFLLLGADRHKSEAVLNAAYDDKAGITAQFNRNVLHVLNRELDANFDLDAFAHLAYYNTAEYQIEMYLVATKPQNIHLRVIDAHFCVKSEERILTEISRKFTPHKLHNLLERGGFALHSHYQSPDNYFSLALAQPK